MLVEDNNKGTWKKRVKMSASSSQSKRARNLFEEGEQEIEESLDSLGKRVCALNSNFQQLAQSNVMTLKLLLSLKEDIAAGNGSLSVGRKTPLDACFSKNKGLLGVTRAHVYTRVIIFEPYPSEVDLCNMFYDMRGTQDKKAVKQWWNDNRKRIMKYDILLFDFFNFNYGIYQGISG